MSELSQNYPDGAYDVIVIGGGHAGCEAAAAAARAAVVAVTAAAEASAAAFFAALASSPSRGRALTGLKKLVIERSLVMIAGEESKGRLRMRETGTCNVLARMHAWASGAVGLNFFLCKFLK